MCAKFELNLLPKKTGRKENIKCFRKKRNILFVRKTEVVTVNQRAREREREPAKKC